MSFESKHLKEIMDLKFQNADIALKLQAKETERRLDNLNGEAERLRNIQATYLPREVYEANQKELNSKLESLSRIVYIGIGGVLVLQIVLKFLIQ